MGTVIPILPIAIPLAAAALIAAGNSILNRRALDIIATIASTAMLAAGLVLTRQTIPTPIIYWLGNWRPESTTHYPIGICLAIDPLAGAMVCMVSLLTLMGFIFSWHYFESVQSFFHSIVLVFAAAMNGLSLSGDLFNMFVFFELMTAAAVSLCGYKSREQGPLQGSLNFAISNTVGAFISLMGIGLIYSYTGTLNIAEAGKTLAQHSPGGLAVSICLALLLCGFLVKAAAFPFHFWLADAHAVAPTPISVLFSGVMVELGLYAAMRVYFGTFAQAMLAQGRSASVIFLIIGSSTTLIGGVLCLMQRHLKRLLAFSTVSHMGLIFLGCALLTPGALAGAGIYLVAHGLIKGALFFCAGILLHHFETVDEYELQGYGRKLYPTMIVMFLAALGLIGLPPFGTAYGAAMIHHDSQEHALWWVQAFFMLGGLLTGSAVLRVTLRTFFGIGQPASPITAGAPRIGEERETHGDHHRTPFTMWLPPALILLLSMGFAIPRSFRITTAASAERLITTNLFRDSVLDSVPARLPAGPPVEHLPEILTPIISLVLAALICFIALYPRKIDKALGRFRGLRLQGAAMQLRKLHSGRVGDYVAWLVFGIAVYAAILLI